jgi:hypothetical protein
MKRLFNVNLSPRLCAVPTDLYVGSIHGLDVGLKIVGNSTGDTTRLLLGVSQIDWGGHGPPRGVYFRFIQWQN